MTPDEADPKGLIRESYRIEGITVGECRSVFLDWALSLPAGMDPAAPLAVLIAHYGTGAPDHPMTAVMHEGAAPGQNRSAAAAGQGGLAARDVLRPLRSATT